MVKMGGLSRNEKLEGRLTRKGQEEEDGEGGGG